MILASLVKYEKPGQRAGEAIRMTTTVSSSAKPQPQIDKAALLAKYKANATSGCVRTATRNISR
jgi:hypothetical protein